MPYSDFTTLGQVTSRFQLREDFTDLFGKSSLRAVRPSAQLRRDLREAEEMPLASEKAKSELVISPVLKEVRRLFPQISIFSGYTLDVNKDAMLNGVCDFIISTDRNPLEVRAPIVCLVEAKNRTLEEGVGQCASEMYAAHVFNEQRGAPVPIISGCVTNAYDWLFMQYRSGTVLVDTERYFLSEIGKILAVFRRMIFSGDSAKGS
ncbi:MAG: hypothetical protein MUD08_04615 [Cytophagales bacterium]|jgi:hypothetical protein|nr:hypothetical protein [Cytophagales bacterium]